jgi:hypothetical protein
MMNQFYLRKHVAIALAMVLPFALLPPLTAWSTDRLAKAGAARWRTLSSGLEVMLGAEECPSEGRDPSDDLAAAVDLAPPAFTISRVRGERASVPRARRPHRIFVGPDMIRRAIPASARPRSTWTDRSGDRPPGMLIQSPGVLSGTIVPGDVLFEAEGQPIASLEQLVAIVGQAYQRKSKYLSGRLYRKGETWAVTVEPGW